MAEFQISLPTDGPCLVMLMGLPGTGKSTLARNLSQELEAPVVSYELLLRAITGDTLLAGSTPRGCPSRACEFALDAIGYHLLQGRRVIYDGSNLSRRVRQVFLNSTKALGMLAVGAWCTAEEPLRTRRALAAGYPPESLHTLAQNWEPPQISEGFAFIATFPSDPELENDEE